MRMHCNKVVPSSNIERYKGGHFFGLTMVHHYLNQQMSARLKGCVCMLPWHAIPFLKGLGILNTNPCENGWPRLWRSCNWQKNTQLNNSLAPKEPYRHSKWADVSPLLKYISGAVAPRLKAPKGPYQASIYSDDSLMLCENVCPFFKADHLLRNDKLVNTKMTFSGIHKSSRMFKQM